MKKYILILLSTFLFLSCNQEEDNTINETSKIYDWLYTKIVVDYADTLETSVIDAKNSVELINSNQQKLQDDLKNIY